MKIFPRFVDFAFIVAWFSFILQLISTYLLINWCSVQEAVFCANAFNVIPTLCSVRFSVSEFMLRSLIHLDFGFVQGDSQDSNIMPEYVCSFIFEADPSQHEKQDPFMVV
ncbi:hypothetical protein STEG23_025894 [Scotinomys teguina]